MRYGVCANTDSATALHVAGYDYIELAVAGDLMPDSSEGDWASKRQEIEAMTLKPEAFNSFVRTGKIVGPEADFDRLERYVDTACRRASQVGGEIIVFGSGGARNIPEGVPRGMAESQLVDFLEICGEAGSNYGVTVVIEPLNKKESNVFNFVSEGAEWARRIGMPNLRNLADTFHMEVENEPLTAIYESRDVLAHVHVADTDRLAPGTGRYEYASLFRTLESAGYDNRISIECNWQGNMETNLVFALQKLKSAKKETG